MIRKELAIQGELIPDDPEVAPFMEEYTNAFNTLMGGMQIIRYDRPNYWRENERLVTSIDRLLVKPEQEDYALRVPRFTPETIKSMIKNVRSLTEEELGLDASFNERLVLTDKIGENKVVIKANEEYSKYVFEPYGVTILAYCLLQTGYGRSFEYQCIRRQRMFEFFEETFKDASVVLFTTEDEFNLLDNENRYAYTSKCSSTSNPIQLAQRILETFAKVIPEQIKTRFKLIEDVLGTKDTLFSLFYYPNALFLRILLSYDVIRMSIDHLMQLKLKMYTDAYEKMQARIERIVDNDLNPDKNEIKKLTEFDNSFEWIIKHENSGLIAPDMTLSAAIDEAWRQIQANCEGFDSVRFLDALNSDPESNFFIDFGKYASLVYKHNKATSNNQYVQNNITRQLQIDKNGAIQQLRPWRAIKSYKGIIFEYNGRRS